MKGNTLPKILNDMIDRKLGDMHCSMPAEVIAYDYTTQKAKVKPLLKRRYQDGTELEFPVITDVPIMMPRANGCFIYIPIKVGDNVTLFFADFSIDDWLLDGKLTAKADMRKHSLNDCYAMPVTNNFGDSLSLDNGDDVFVKNGDLKISIKNNGKIKIENATEDLTDLIKQLCAACEAITTKTAIGIQPVLNKATFTTIKGKIDGFVS